MTAPPVDLSVLAAQTGNDARLQRDVLRLYLEQAPADLERLKAATSGEERRSVAHRMVGSARAIGASEVARLAAAVEKRPAASGEAVAALGRALAKATRFIGAHLEASPAVGQIGRTGRAPRNRL